MPVAPVTDWGQATTRTIVATRAMFQGAIPKLFGYAVMLVVGSFLPASSWG